MKKIIITTGVVAVAGGIATVLLTPSCQTCEVEPKPSVIVQFVGEGEAGVDFVAADEVTYVWTDADGNELAKAAECGDDDCSEWLIGNGLGGTYEVHAKVCGADYQETVTVNVNEDGCEVDTQIIQMPVSTAACTDIHKPASSEPVVAGRDVKSAKTCTLEARPSVLALVMTTVGDMAIPVHPDKVFYTWDGEPHGRTLPGTCINEDCSQFIAGLEQTGTFTLGAEVCGKETRAQVTVGKTADGCHVDTQGVSLIVDMSDCDKPPVYDKPTDTSCDPQLWPSAFVVPVTDGGDVWLPHPTEELIYINNDNRNRGYCVQPTTDGKCSLWITGWGHTGRFRAFTETCERTSEVTYTVEMAEDGCHPMTKFVPVFVDTTGCITPPTPGGEDPSTPDTPDSVAPPPMRPTDISK